MFEPVLKTSPLHQLLETPAPAALGPGSRPGVQSIPAINAAMDDALGGSSKAPGRSDLVRALLLLWHDHLDEAHVIAQEHETAEGSYVHAILHRREPDYSNAKYWFHRVRQHSAYDTLAVRAAVILQADAVLKAQLLPDGKWDAAAFVDACEEASRRAPGDARVRLLQELQKAEFATLLDYLVAQ